MLPLPFNVPIPQDSTASVRQDGYFAGFENVQLAPLPWIPPMEPGPMGPMTSLWFRRGNVVVPDPWDAIATVFADHFPARPRQDAQASLMLERTVVQITRLAPAEPIIPDVAQEPWISDQFDRGLDYLNEFLTLLASVSNEPAIGPITVYELPFAIPFVVRNLSDPELAERPLEPCMLLLHANEPGVADDIPLERFEQVGRVQAFQRRAGGHPFTAYAQAMVAARRSLDLGQLRVSVMEAGTGAELLVTTVVREAAAARGESPTRISGRVKAPFKNRFIEHFLPLTGLSGDIADKSTAPGRWWQDSYLLRNRVVHEGYAPSREEALNCLAAAREMMAETGKALQADPATKRVGELLVTFAEPPRWRELVRKIRAA